MTSPLRLGARLLAAILLLSLPLGVAGQEPSPLRLELDPDGGGGVRAHFEALLADPGILRSLEAGLPVRIRMVTELWRDGWLDSQRGRDEWRATIRLDPLAQSYTLETGDGILQEVGSPAEAERALASGLRIPLSPDAEGRYYYLSRLELETLALSDLDELRRWLRGELAPAIGGEAELGSALGRGLRRIVVRALGLPALRFEARTPRFNWEG